MWELRVCRACLATGVRLLDVHSYPLEQCYQAVVGQNALSYVELPQYACYECAALLRRCSAFRDKCLQARSTLHQLYSRSQQITEQDVNKVDRHKCHLTSALNFYSAPPESIYELVHNDMEEVKVKEELIVHSSLQEDTSKQLYLEVDPVLEDVKEEDDHSYLDLPSPMPRASSDDDDEPLSFRQTLKDQKKSKVKRTMVKKKVGKRKKIEDVKPFEMEIASTEIADVIPIDTTDVIKVTCEPKVEPKVRKPRKKRKTDDEDIGEQVKKKRGPKPNPDRITQDEADMEEYVTIVKLTVEEQLEEIVKRQDSSNFRNAPHKCKVCFKGFVDADAFRNHVVKHDPSAGDIVCPICKFRFQTKRTLQKHSANHEKKYACKSCSYVSKTTTQAKQHQKWHKGITYKCQYCEEVSTKWTSYLSHVRIKHPSQFICGVCGYSFVSKLGLAMHKTMMHKDVIEKKEEEPATNRATGPFCKECDVQFASLEAWKRHMVTSAKHSLNNEFGNGCRVCGETFQTAEELRLHHRREHARKRPKNYGKKPSEIMWPIKCEHCDEEIPNAREYWTHFRRAHPDKKYPINKSFMCEICGKGFRGNAFLVYHKRTHFEERMYKCGQCAKSFFNRTNLQMHEKTHSDHRPYPCTVCFKAFKLKGALDRHFRSHTGVKPYECEFCGKAFGQSNSRKLHVRTVHLKQPAPYISKSRLERRRAHEAVKINPPFPY